MALKVSASRQIQLKKGLKRTIRYASSILTRISWLSKAASQTHHGPMSSYSSALRPIYLSMMQNKMLMSLTMRSLMDLIAYPLEKCAAFASPWSQLAAIVLSQVSIWPLKRSFGLSQETMLAPCSSYRGPMLINRMSLSLAQMISPLESLKAPN